VPRRWNPGASPSMPAARPAQSSTRRLP